MKTVIIAFVTLLFLPFSLTAQIKPVSKNAAKSPKALDQKQNVISKNPDLKLPDRPSVSANFRVKSADQLRTQASGMKPFEHTNIFEKLYANAGNPAYKTGSGVVLDASNAHDSQTGSVLFLAGVSYDGFTTDLIKNHSPVTLCQTLNRPGRYAADVLAIFEDMPTASHLYLLTLGSSVDPSKVKVAIGTSYPTTWVEIPKDRIVSTPESSEIQILFSTNANVARATGSRWSFREELGNDFLPRCPLIVWVTYDIGGLMNVKVYFHHIHLVQLD
jgi:hypothetical protein